MSLRPVLVAACLVVQSAFAASQIAAGPQMMRMQGPPPPQAVVGRAAALHIYFVGGLPTVEVKINGKGPFKVGLDTGAPGGPHLTARLVSELGLSAAGQAMVSDPTGENSVPIKLYHIESIAFGGVSVRGWIGSVEPERPRKMNAPDGVVGLDAFAGYVVTIDYRHSRLSIRRGSLPAADGKSIFSYGGQMAPSAPLRIEGRTILAHIDTGNTVAAVIVPKDFAEGLSHKGNAKPSGVAHTISNTVQMFSLPIEGQAWVGSTPLAISAVGYPSIIPFANIGSLGLRGTAVEVDPANQRVRLRLSK